MSIEPPAEAPSVLSICNIALSKLGEPPLYEIIANGPPAARMCYMHYHPVRREVLCANSWTFASRLTTLTTPRNVDATLNWEHTLPADCLRVLRVASPEWTLRGRSIFCTGQEVRLLYIADEEDCRKFDPLFIEALATRLACKLCIPLIGSTTARKALTEEYNRIALPQAAHFNSVQAHSNDTHPLYRLWKQSLGGSPDGD